MPCVALSEDSAFEMAFLPHLVGDSVINRCLGRENSCRAASSSSFFQENENASTTFFHTPMAPYPLVSHTSLCPMKRSSLFKNQFVL